MEMYAEEERERERERERDYGAVGLALELLGAFGALGLPGWTWGSGAAGWLAAGWLGAGWMAGWWLAGCQSY